jgi:hypothetical protein
MANVLSDDRKQQVLALGRLGWSLRRIEQATGVRRETASIYLKTAGIAVRPAGGWGRRPAVLESTKYIPEAGVVVSGDAGKGADSGEPEPATTRASDLPISKPANEVTTDLATGSAPGSAPPAKRAPSASACEPYREIIEVALARGRNAMAIWQDLVSQGGFAGAYTSVKRFVRRLRGTRPPEAHPVTVTAPGEDYGEFRVMVRNASTCVGQAGAGWCFFSSHFP